MTIVLELTIVLAVWVFLYSVSDDILKFISKYMVYFTMATVFFEAMNVYGEFPSVLLFSATLAFLLLQIVLDFVYPIQKPAEKVMKVRV